MTVPTDLVPLPTAPWDIRPAELPLDIEECRTALWEVRGNITRAAELLKVSSSRLRTFVEKSEYLSREQREAREQLLDAAEDNVYEALTDHADPGRKDSMTRFILPQLGQSRGYGNVKNGINVNTSGKGRLLIAWDDGESIVGDTEDGSEMIDVTPQRAAE